MSTEQPSPPKQVGTVIRSWWKALQPDESRSDPGKKAGDRATLARLRRCATPAEAMAEPSVIDLWHRLGRKSDEVERMLPFLAIAAHVLAHLREDNRGHPMKALGRQNPQDEDATLKPLRLRRLLAAREPDELMREMRRLVALADRKLDVGEVAAAILFWDDSTRARWAFEYYAAGFAAPEPTALETLP